MLCLTLKGETGSKRRYDGHSYVLELASSAGLASLRLFMSASRLSVMTELLQKRFPRQGAMAEWHTGSLMRQRGTDNASCDLLQRRYDSQGRMLRGLL